MQNADLFVSMAELAGVFVGFGALIAVRRRGSIELSDFNGIRWVVTTGIWAVITALVPAIVGGYGVAGHELWLVSSLFGLALLAIMIAVFIRTPENVAQVEISLATLPRTMIVLVMAPTIWLPVVSLVVALVVVVLGALPNQEQALYLTAVGLGLVMSALGLFVEVFWPGRRTPFTG
jgi:hypothetical protein